MKLSDQSLLHLKALVNGEWVAASDGSTFEVIDPATSACIAVLPELDVAQCNEAVDGAAAAAVQLKQLTSKERGALLRRWYDLVVAARDDLSQIITAENGKPLVEAQGEVTYAADFLEWFSGVGRWKSGMVLDASKSENRVVTIKQPVGICGIITPWNFPAAMITRKVAAAIAAGCPCVVKPAAETPLTALALAELGRRAGLPAGALSIITTKKNTISVGKVLTQHPQIRKFSFTGSTAVGKLLAAQCTSTMKRVSLELGGNAPFIVFDDAELGHAVDAVIASKFRLSGQTCVCANRVYVQAGIYDRFAAAIVDKVQNIKLGPGNDPKSNIGPLITPSAALKVLRHVEDAVELGAKVLVGGKLALNLGEAFFQPTVLGYVSPRAQCAKEETFGPLLPLTRFETEDDVVHLANSTEVGLAGYFFTENLSRAWRVAEALEVGMVGVNTGIISDVASPFGGIKESGQGREGSNLGIEEYLEVKSVTFRINY
ncbi:Aldehyde/histidinol dehydrogenase [Bisporella sp. PMI_857]|nr:Aldehyde/histidinol dehydrogenase [Bisporella sp. PMI_857]